MAETGINSPTIFAAGCAAVLLGTAGWAAPACAQAAGQKTYAIGGEDLATALRAFALTTGRDVVFDPALVRGKASRGVRGQLGVEEALNRLLGGSGLTYVRLATGGFAVRLAPVPPKRARESAAPPVTASTNNVFAVNEVVVTGTAGSIDKFTAPYAVSTLKGQPILDRAPHSLADLLRGQPGLVVENSGGEGGNENIVVRGLPFAGFRLIDVLEDGLPIYESNYERFMNIDSLYRVDLMTERAEIERGGTASIFSNNASGGVVNLITRHGGATPEGAVQVSGGSDGLFRLQGYQSGPLTDRLLYSIGGSYRRDDGLRDQGFSPANDGGQIQAGATYLLPRGKLFADVKYINDRSAFYTDIPLTNPLTGGSLSKLIDPNSGTLTSSSFEHVQIRTLNGAGQGAVVSRDLGDGVHPDMATVTAGADLQFDDGWRLGERARFVSGRIGIDGIFNAATPTAASSFLAANLAAARQAFPGTARLDYSVVGSGAEYDPASTAGLVMANNYDSSRTEIRYVVNDLHLSRSFAPVGGLKDEMTFGLYASSYAYRHQELLNAILENVKSDPNALDIRALSATGAVLGYVTENGFLSYGAGSNNGSLNGVALAGYAENTLHLTPRWQVDAGVRTESRRQSGVQGVLGVETLSDTGPLAARAVSGVVGYAPHREDLHGTAFTVGGAYDILANLNGFVRYSQSYSLPAFITIISGATLPNGAPEPVSTVNQAEGGLKFKTRTLQLAATAYYAHFDQISTTTQVAQPNGAIANSNVVFNSTSVGLEAEGDWRPTRWFDLSGTSTVQSAKIDSVQTLTGPSAASQVDGVIPRVPGYLVSLEPAYIFSVGAWRGRAFADIYSVGRRFQDYSNLSILPGYTTLDLGLTANPNAHVEFRVLVSNVTDSAGLTEGNARAAALNVGTVGDATVGRPIFGREASISALYRW
jgi:iron complex outermembrane recepter protein